MATSTKKRTLFCGLFGETPPRTRTAYGCAQNPCDNRLQSALEPGTLGDLGMRGTKPSVIGPSCPDTHPREEARDAGSSERGAQTCLCEDDEGLTESRLPLGKRNGAPYCLMKRCLCPGCSYSLYKMGK